MNDMVEEGSLLKVYKIKVQYGRGEMRSTFLVAATSLRKARKLANDAAPVPAHEPDITGHMIHNLCYRTDESVVICKL